MVEFDKATRWSLGVWAALTALDVAWHVPPWACWYNRMSISDWAAWVQALGSIAAIVGAFAVARYQGRQAEHLQLTAEGRRERDFVELLRGAVAPIDAACELVVELFKEDKGKPRRPGIAECASVMRYGLEQMNVLLRSVDRHYEATFFGHRLAFVCSRFITDADAYVAERDLTAHEFTGLAQSLIVVQEARTRLHVAFDSARARIR